MRPVMRKKMTTSRFGNNFRTIRLLAGLGCRCHDSSLTECDLIPENTGTPGTGVPRGPCN